MNEISDTIRRPVSGFRLGQRSIESKASREHIASPTGHVLVRETERGTCHEYHRYNYHLLLLEEWCEVCQGAQPLWEAYRKAATAAGVATRHLIRVWTGGERRASREMTDLFCGAGKCGYGLLSGWI